ncbi:hypothetical protein BD413DRAFT_618715 [Trametes elegans]|nr:hypothetical protein BD413DRAFT_618715 [Trametes elegans]
MDPDKSPHIPPSAARPAASATRRMPSPSDRVALAPAAGPSQPPHGRSQTTLPPIHHLHPGLAHASMQPPPPLPPPQPPRAVSPYMHGATYPLPSASTLGVRPAPDDSDPETSQGRQKQKRRRQALSCTECKRRKIKCDRANPCGPCVRRGEQAKCQWHVIEPMEKYVTRSEFDELKARLLDLEHTVTRALGPAPRPASATMPMTSGHPAEPVHGTAILPYQAYGAPPAVPYPPRPASPRSPVRGGEHPPPPMPSHYYRHPMSRSPTVAYRHPHPPPPPPPPPPGMAGPSTPARQREAPHLPPPSASPRGSPVRPGTPPGMRTSTSPSVRRSSISLAEITTPYHAEPPLPPRKPPLPGAHSGPSPTASATTSATHHHRTPSGAGPGGGPGGPRRASPTSPGGGPKNQRAQTTPPPGRRLRPSPPPGPAPAPPSPHLRIHIVDCQRPVPV